MAANDGLVVYSYNGMRGYGNAVILLHPDRSMTLYAHCRSTFVFAGQQVRRGEVIAEVGNTGLAHGAHLHFEWRSGGVPRDPLPHVVERPPGRHGQPRDELTTCEPPDDALAREEDPDHDEPDDDALDAGEPAEAAGTVGPGHDDGEHDGEDDDASATGPASAREPDGEPTSDAS